MHRPTLPPPSARILHLITFLKYDPSDTNVDEILLRRASFSPPRCTGRYSICKISQVVKARRRNQLRMNLTPWKITRGIFGLELSHSFLSDFPLGRDAVQTIWAIFSYRGFLGCVFLRHIADLKREERNDLCARVLAEDHTYSSCREK